jgi:MOSC domain-containing protein YiiM
VGEVLHLYRSIKRGEPVQESEEVHAIADKGFQDCLHARGGNRQVLLIDVETLDEFGIPPGRAKESITTRGIALSELQVGQQIRAGEALLEITEPCTLCNQLDKIREGLREKLRGRRGIMCKVVESGKIRRGEQLKVVGEQA